MLIFFISSVLFENFYYPVFQDSFLFDMHTVEGDQNRLLVTVV
jgi:hypothetical protein